MFRVINQVIFLFSITMIFSCGPEKEFSQKSVQNESQFGRLTALSGVTCEPEAPRDPEVSEDPSTGNGGGSGSGPGIPKLDECITPQQQASEKCGGVEQPDRPDDNFV